MISIIVKSMAAPVVLSLIGPIYFAYQRDPFVAVIGYSFLCTALYLGWTWKSVVHSYRLLQEGGAWAVSGLYLSIATTIFVPFLILQTCAFYMTMTLLRFKTGHCGFQIGPLVETGQYPT